MEGPEKRKYPRLGAMFELTCNKVGSERGQIHIGRTVNISTGGCFFQTESDVFEPGNLVKVELTIPPTSGQLEFGGKLAGFARVLRANSVRDSISDMDLSSGGYGVALEFCGTPKYSL